MRMCYECNTHVGWGQVTLQSLIVPVLRTMYLDVPVLCGSITTENSRSIFFFVTALLQNKILDLTFRMID